jgi:hypothetical protein
VLKLASFAGLSATGPLDFGLRQSCCPVVLGLVPAEAVGLVCWEPQACTALVGSARARPPESTQEFAPA